VARSIHLSLPTVTGIFDRLEKRGLITRRRDGVDRRAVVIEPTAQGRQVLDSAPSLLQDRFRDRLAELPAWEQTRMLSVLQRMAAMMDAEGPPVPEPGAAVQRRAGDSVEAASQGGHGGAGRSWPR
jgi:DNA-binding MarR family transcriptional regulator